MAAPSAITARMSAPSRGVHSRSTPNASRAPPVFAAVRAGQRPAPAPPGRVRHRPVMARLAVVDGRDLDRLDSRPDLTSSRRCRLSASYPPVGERDLAQRVAAEQPHAVLGVRHPAAGGGEQRDAGGAVADSPDERHRAALAAVADHDVGAARLASTKAGIRSGACWPSESSTTIASGAVGSASRRAVPAATALPLPPFEARRMTRTRSSPRTRRASARWPPGRRRPQGRPRRRGAACSPRPRPRDRRRRPGSRRPRARAEGAAPGAPARAGARR